MGSPLNPSARFSSVTSVATVCLHDSPHLKSCTHLETIRSDDSKMAGIRLFVFVNDFNHRIDWHIFNEPGKRELQCCSEHGRVSQISCHSLVRDLTAHVYVVVCLLCHAPDDSVAVE